MRNIILICTCILCFSSCYCDKTYVGNVNQTESLVHVASIRNPHVLGGLIVTHNQKALSIPDSVKDYVIERKFTFGDLLVNILTLGIYSPSTTKFYMKKDDPNVTISGSKFGSKSFAGSVKYVYINNTIPKDSIRYVKGLLGTHKEIYTDKYWKRVHK